MSRAEEIKVFSEAIMSFFTVFDGLFLYNDKAEELLQETKSSLEEKVLRNESCLPVIIAMGGSYDSNVDRAKIKEIEALQQLLKARKSLQAESELQRIHNSRKNDFLRAFGLE